MVHIKAIILTTSLIILAFSARLQAQISSTWADTLNTVFEQSFLKEGMNGLAGAVVFSDGSIWSSAAGKHGTTDLSTDFLYDIGSNTKSMVSTIILLLEEEGALSIDDSLYSFIDPIKNVSYGITIKQLLSHRSGVFSFTEHPDFYDEIEADDYKFWHPDTVLNRFLLAEKFAPGKGFSYSNTGYLLLGKVIESIEGKPFNEVLAERIYKPIGISNMFLAQYDDYTSIKTGAWLSASFYYPSIESFLGAAWAAGGVVSQPEDFASYAHALLRGDLLSEASFEKMRKGTKLNNGSTYGLGIIESTYMGKKYLGHGGTTLQNSEMEYSLESDFSLVLINIDNNYYDETRRAKNTFLELLEYIEETNKTLGLNKTNNYSNKLQAYPNPSANQITLSFKNRDICDNMTLVIRDITGKQVLEQTINCQGITLNKADIGIGMYFVSIIQNGIITETQKLSFY